jgi:hypothetical protein
MSNNPHYKIVPDEVESRNFRVAHHGSEYTVSYKKRLLHGLMKREANKMLAFLEEKRASAIDRLADAITEYQEADLRPAQRAKFISELSVKHRISKKTISTAILMLAGGINAGGKL